MYEFQGAFERLDAMDKIVVGKSLIEFKAFMANRRRTMKRVAPQNGVKQAVKRRDEPFLVWLAANPQVTSLQVADWLRITRSAALRKLMRLQQAGHITFVVESHPSQHNPMYRWSVIP